MGSTFFLDQTILFWFNSWVFVYPWLDALLVFLLDWGLSWFFLFFALLCGVGLFPRFRGARKSLFRVAVLAFISLVASRAIGVEILRTIFPRVRPFEALDSLSLLTTTNVFGASYLGVRSFPSGHAALSFALAASVSFFYPRTSVLFFLGAALVSLARVAAGFHWPSDIFTGAAVGILTAGLVWKVVTKILRS